MCVRSRPPPKPRPTTAKHSAGLWARKGAKSAIVGCVRGTDEEDEEDSGQEEEGEDDAADEGDEAGFNLQAMAEGATKSAIADMGDLLAESVPKVAEACEKHG